MKPENFTIRLQTLLPDGTLDPKGGEATLEADELRLLRSFLSERMHEDPGRISDSDYNVLSRILFVIDCIDCFV